MANQMYFRTYYSPNSSKKRITEGDLKSATLQAGNEITVYADKVPADKVYHFGWGSRNTEDGLNAFIYADIKDNSTTPVDINGQLVLAITDSTQEDVLAKRYFESLGDLRDAVNDKRTERPLMPELQPGASEDRHMELRIVADSSSDGATVGPSNCDVKLNYGTVSL